MSLIRSSAGCFTPRHPCSPSGSKHGRNTGLLTELPPITARAAPVASLCQYRAYSVPPDEWPWRDRRPTAYTITHEGEIFARTSCGLRRCHSKVFACMLVLGSFIGCARPGIPPPPPDAKPRQHLGIPLWGFAPRTPGERQWAQPELGAALDATPWQHTTSPFGWLAGSKWQPFLRLRTQLGRSAAARRGALHTAGRPL